MLLFQLSGFQWLDQYQYHHNLEIHYALHEELKEELSKLPTPHTLSLQSNLERKPDLWITLKTLAHNDLSMEDLGRLKEPGNANGFVSETNGGIYIPLENQQFLEVFSMNESLFYDYIVEWSLFFTLVFANLSFLLVVMFRYYKKDQAFLQKLLNQQKYDSYNNVMEASSNQEQADIYQLASDLLEQQAKFKKAFAKQLESHKDLLHGVAHEFRSPMARMQFALEMMSEGDGANFHNLKDTINQNLNELDSLVGELLNFARLQHKGNINVTNKILLLQVCEDAIKKVQAVYHEIQFSIASDQNVEFSGSYALIERAIVNVLRNAGRYAKQDCRIDFSVTNNLVEISIEDDGHGIPPGKRERIFEPFTRLDPSRSRDSGGSGLGLAIVKSIMELHNGDVEVTESALGGAKFTLTVPLGPNTTD